MDATQIDTVVLDLDGTLVDSVPVHVLSWQEAFRDVGLRIPSHRIHRAIGMGGDRLVGHVAGDAVESAVGDELRTRHLAHVERHFGVISPTEGASELLETLRAHRLTTVLASSSPPELTERLLELVEGGPERLDRAITGEDVSRSKPDGEPVDNALQAASARRAVMVGDAVWDVSSARDVGVPCIGLLTGGISEGELRGAGAVVVHESPLALAQHLDATGELVAPVSAGSPRAG